jgi:hypothetical protein
MAPIPTRGSTTSAKTYADPWAAPALPSTRHCAMFAADIAAFGSREDHDLQRALREALYRIVDGACRIADVPTAICHYEDRGDGILLIAPPCVSAETLLDALINHLRAGVRRHNRLASAAASIRLRTAVHAGHVGFDAEGVYGPAVIQLFRMLEAPQVKRCFDAAGAEFAVVTSHRLYEEVIQHAPGLIDPSVYQPITMTLKETRTRGWIWLCSDRDATRRAMSPVSEPGLATTVAHDRAQATRPRRPAVEGRTARPDD